jgi:hypothetical protein
LKVPLLAINAANLANPLAEAIELAAGISTFQPSSL